jgi:hypothetical protein
MATLTSTSSKRTTDHDEIRHWVEERDGRPATIIDTAKLGEEAGLLRIDFPQGAPNPPLELITWEVFFKKFDQDKLAMVYQEEGESGETSYFCKFVAR